MAATVVRSRGASRVLFYFWRHSNGRRFVSAGFELDDVIKDSIHTSEDEGGFADCGFQLYESHIPTSMMQKVLLSAGSALVALYNPTRADMVATLGETTGLLALKKMHHKMSEDPVGQKILHDNFLTVVGVSGTRKGFLTLLAIASKLPVIVLERSVTDITTKTTTNLNSDFERERPRLTPSTLDLNKLRLLPDGSFGKEYVRGMDRNRITPDRDEVKFVDDTDLAYVMQRYREVHDFVHTLAGLSISVPHEIAVKWYEMIQTGLPMCALSSFVAPLRLTSRERANLRKYYIPWAVYCGYQSKFFMNVYFEKHFEEPIEDLRQRMNFVPAPKIPKAS